MRYSAKRGGTLKAKSVYVLGKALKLARPHFLCVAVVDDVVARFEATVVEITILVNTRIIVISKTWMRRSIVSNRA